MKELVNKICTITKEYNLMPMIKLNNMGIYYGQSYVTYGTLLHFRNEIIKIAYDMLNSKNYERAAAALEICHVIQPKDQSVGNDYFYALVLSKKYQEAATVLDELILNKNSYFETDYRFYSLLLSYLTNLPEIMQKRLLGLEPKNIKILSDDSRFDYESLADYNLLRRSVYFADFKVAKSVLSHNLAWDHSLESNVNRLLVEEASNEDALESQTINKLITEENYAELSKYIAKLESKHKISLARVYIKLISDEILRMKVKQKPLYACQKQTDKMSEAIKYHNYKLAIELYQNFGLNTKKYNKNPEVITLLNKAIMLRSELTSKMQKDVQEKTHEHYDAQSWTDANEFMNLKFDIENYFKTSQDLSATLILPIKSHTTQKHITEIVNFNSSLNALFINNYVIIHRANSVKEKVDINQLYEEAKKLESLEFHKEALEIYYTILLNTKIDYNLAIKIAACSQHIGYSATCERFIEISSILASDNKSHNKLVNDIKKSELDKYNNLNDALRLAYYNDDYEGPIYTILKQIKDGYKNGLAIETVCKACGLRNEYIDAVKVIIARNAFINNDKILGRSIMNEVTKSDHLYGVALELYFHLNQYMGEIILRKQNKNNILVRSLALN